MAKIAVALMVALFAGLALAQTSTTCPLGATVFTKPTGCAGYNTCEANLCNCVERPNQVNCLANVSSLFSCPSLQTCFSTFVNCVSVLANTERSNSSSVCGMWAVTLHTQVLTAASTAFTGSALQRACATQVCTMLNSTGRTCDFGGVNFTNVCTFNNIVAPGTTTSAPGTPSPSSASAVSVAVVAVLAAVAALL
jgi:hypothetical protein